MGDRGVISIYGMNVVDRDLPTIDRLLIRAKTTTRTVCIQRITFVPLQYMDGTLVFLDSRGGPQHTLTVQARQKPSSGRRLFYLDFGPRGWPLTLGADLILGVVGGAVGRLHIEAFQRGK